MCTSAPNRPESTSFPYTPCTAKQANVLITHLNIPFRLYLTQDNYLKLTGLYMLLDKTLHFSVAPHGKNIGTW